MKTVLVGQFQNGVMSHAKPANIVAERCNDGIKEIRFSVPKRNAPTFKYSRANRLYIGDHPTTMDPYEKKLIYIKALERGGEGLFAKRSINRHELVSYYGGIIWNETEAELFPENQTMYEM